MSEQEILETSEAQIAVHWQEEDYIHPSTPALSPRPI